MNDHQTATAMIAQLNAMDLADDFHEALTGAIDAVGELAQQLGHDSEPVRIYPTRLFEGTYGECRA